MKRRAAVVAAILVSGLLIPSRAQAAVTTAAASVYSGKEDCGSRNKNFTRKGAVHLRRKGNLVSVRTSLNNAQPGATYHGNLILKRTCTGYPDNVVNITTDGNGNGTSTLSLLVPKKESRFFVYMACTESCGVSEELETTTMGLPKP